MNQELQFKLQAWLDGELPEAEARQAAELANTDHAARALVAELRMTKGFLAGNELEAPLPETLDFHWSKIRREIERLDNAEAAQPRASWSFAWRRLLAPLSGVAMVAFVTVVSLNFLNRPPIEDALANLVEVENPSEHIGSISYKSQAENMFVVWLYDKESDTEVKTDMPEPMDDLLLQ